MKIMTFTYSLALDALSLSKCRNTTFDYQIPYQREFDEFFFSLKKKVKQIMFHQIEYMVEKMDNLSS